MLPGTNFDSGGVVVNYWSTVAQPKTYEQRLAMVERIEGLTHPEQVRDVPVCYFERRRVLGYTAPEHNAPFRDS